MDESPHAPIPGTTPIPLSLLLADPELGLERIAGPADDRLIGIVGTTEVDDPAPYLLGGELLLTAGVRLPETAAGIDAYVRGVVGAGAAALGFGVVPVHDEVPAELIAACDRHALPLLRVPDGTPFVAISRLAHSAMARTRSRDLQQINEAQAALAAAAGRPDALNAVINQLAARLGAWAVLIDARGNELFAAGTRPDQHTRRRLRDLALTVVERRPARSDDARPQPPTAAADHHAGLHLVVHTLPAGAGAAGRPLVLGLATATPPSAVNRSVTGVAIALLALLTSPRHALGGGTGRAAALVRLLLGETPENVAPLLQPGHGPGRWLVAHGRLTHSQPGPAPAGDPVRLAALGTVLGTPHLDVEGNRLVALVPYDRDARLADGEAIARLGWTLGYSAPLPTAELPIAATQAERALRRALAEGRAVVRHRTEELSVHGLVDTSDATALARTRFAPLADAGPPGPAVLLETLRTWLSQHGSWDRTAAALELHRNTVRQRIGKVGELLDTDLQDADVRMELWFALRWLPAEHSGRTDRP